MVAEAVATPVVENKPAAPKQRHIAFVTAVQGAETGVIGTRFFYTREELVRYLEGQRKSFVGRRHRQAAFNESWRVNAEFYEKALKVLNREAKTGLGTLQQKPWDLSKMMTAYHREHGVKTDDVVFPDDKKREQNPGVDISFLDDGPVPHTRPAVPRSVAAKAEAMPVGGISEELGEE